MSPSLISIRSQITLAPIIVHVIPILTLLDLQLVRSYCVSNLTRVIKPHSCPTSIQVAAACRPPFELFSLPRRLPVATRAYNQLYQTMAESRAVLAARAALASIDLSSYDPEQSKLMSERCILVDERDNAIGAMDKKTCVLLSFNAVNSSSLSLRIQVT